MSRMKAPVRSPSVSREKQTPFLVRAFVKIGGETHRLTLFEDGMLPTTDEHQLFAWKDATLKEMLTILRNTAPHVAEYRHPLARFTFKAAYADPTNKGRFAQKDLGRVGSRDILGEPGALGVTAPSLLEDISSRDLSEREKEEKTLEEMRFVPGDYMLIAVHLPKQVSQPSELTIKGSGAGAASSTWKGGPKGDNGWGKPSGGPGIGRSGGHWRGESNAPSGRGRGGGRGGGDFGRDREIDGRVPPPRRRDSPPPRSGGGWDRNTRGGRGDRRSRSRSRSPPRRRR
ncbi:Sin3 associated polypeptide p18-domain-containing protein [Panaeolus papilionaceus]|nr:Sin3 associated polypeptide p18-domain-containing protein [Panaeolus papilionaceus]